MDANPEFPIHFLNIYSQGSLARCRWGSKSIDELTHAKKHQEGSTDAGHAHHYILPPGGIAAQDNPGKNENAHPASQHQQGPGYQQRSLV
jgi:hypothetical protein